MGRFFYSFVFLIATTGFILGGSIQATFFQPVVQQIQNDKVSEQSDERKYTLEEIKPKCDERPFNDRLGCDPVAYFTRLLALLTGGLVAGTAVLALVTFKLWRSTGALVAKADANSKKQLRAYVHLSAVYFVRRSDDAFQVIAKVKNFGQTPARNVVLHVEAINFMDMADRTFDFSPSNIGISKFDDIAPGQIRRITPKERRFNEHVRTEVTAQRAAIYFWGVIKYDDVFGDPQTLEFRRFVEEIPLEITPASGSLGQFKIPKFGAIHMRVCDEGNKST